MIKTRWIDFNHFRFLPKNRENKMMTPAVIREKIPKLFITNWM